MFNNYFFKFFFFSFASLWDSHYMYLTMFDVALFIFLQIGWYLPIDLLCLTLLLLLPFPFCGWMELCFRHTPSTIQQTWFWPQGIWLHNLLVHPSVAKCGFLNSAGFILTFPHCPCVYHLSTIFFILLPLPSSLSCPYFIRFPYNARVFQNPIHLEASLKISEVRHCACLFLASLPSIHLIPTFCISLCGVFQLKEMDGSALVLIWFPSSTQNQTECPILMLQTPLLCSDSAFLPSALSLSPDNPFSSSNESSAQSALQALSSSY